MQPPRIFQERYGPLAGNPEIFPSQRLPKAFRVNTLKATVPEVKKKFQQYDLPFQQVPWYPDAFTSSPAALQTMEHALGQIYSQELSSMLPPLLVRPELEAAVSAGQFVLDACAAPGSKTTQLAALMGNRGTIIANDSDYNRLRALKFNCEKTGALNVVVTNSDLRRFPDTKFPAILVDAPCSGEGRAGSDPKFFRYWSLSRIHRFAYLQKQLLEKAFRLLVPGGLLVYSTCTFAPEENEEVIDSLLSKSPATIEKISLPLSWSPGITSWGKKTFSPGLKNTVRIWPHLHQMEGFFLAKIRKPL